MRVDPCVGIPWYSTFHVLVFRNILLSPGITKVPVGDQPPDIEIQVNQHPPNGETSFDDFFLCIDSSNDFLVYLETELRRIGSNSSKHRPGEFRRLTYGP